MNASQRFVPGGLVLPLKRQKGYDSAVSSAVYLDPILSYEDGLVCLFVALSLGFVDCLVKKLARFLSRLP